MGMAKEYISKGAAICAVTLVDVTRQGKLKKCARLCLRRLLKLLRKGLGLLISCFLDKCVLELGRSFADHSLLIRAHWHCAVD
jgi:hypothetical protein